MKGLRMRRLAKGLSLLALAKLLGVSQFSVIRWEQGKTSPTAEKLKKLAEILETTPNDLLGVEDKEGA